MTKGHLEAFSDAVAAYRAVLLCAACSYALLTRTLIPLQEMAA